MARRQIDQLLLDRFQDKLREYKLLNLSGLDYLIEAVQDDLNSRLRPQNIVYAYFALIIAVILGIGQPLFSRGLETISDPKTLIALTFLVIEVCWMIFWIALMYYSSHISPQTQREIYLQSLHAIRIRLLHTESQSNTAATEPQSHENSVPLAPEPVNSLLTGILVSAVVAFAVTKEIRNMQNQARD